MNFSRIAIALCLAVAALSPTSAQAYPPGKNIAVALTSGMVKPGTALTANVTNAKPGSVTVIWGTASLTATAAADGKAGSTFKPAKTGVYTVLVTDTATTGNTTSTFVYVPAVTFPKPTSIKANATFTVVNAKPGTVVTIKIGSKSFKGTVKGTAGKTNKLDIKLKLPKKGSNTVSVSVGTDKKLVFSGKAVGK